LLELLQARVVANMSAFAILPERVEANTMALATLPVA
jgi:hypothetical protein